MQNTEIKAIIEQAQNAFSTTVREKTGKTITILDSTSPLYEKLSTALFEVVKTPVDSVYEYARQIVVDMDFVLDEDELDGETEDVEEVIFDTLSNNGTFDGEIYTWDLTAWLAESVYHVEYLDQALDAFEPKDGIQALQVANQLYKEAIARSLIHELFTKE